MQITQLSKVGQVVPGRGTGKREELALEFLKDCPSLSRTNAARNFHLRFFADLFSWLDSNGLRFQDVGIREALSFKRFLATVKGVKGRTLGKISQERYRYLVKRFWSFLQSRQIVSASPFEVWNAYGQSDANEEVLEQRALIEDYLAAISQERGNSQASLVDIRNLQVPLHLWLEEANLRFSEVTQAHAQEFKLWLESYKSFASGKVFDAKRRKFVLWNARRFWNYLEGRKLVSFNPFTAVCAPVRVATLWRDDSGPRAFFLQWCQHLETQRVSKTALARLEYPLRKLFDWLAAHNLDLETFGPQSARDFEESLRQCHSEQAVYSIGRSIRRFWSFLVSKQIVSASAFSDPRKKPYQIPTGYSDLLVRYWEDLKARGTRIRSFRKLANGFRRFFWWLEDQGLELAHLSIIQAEEFQGWLLKCQNNGEIAERRVSGLMVHARGFFNFLVKESLVPENPFLYTQAVPGSYVLPKNLPQEEAMGRLLDELEHFERYALLSRAKVAYRLHVMAEVLYSSGLRIEEACSLTLSDVDLRRSLLYVREGKGGAPRLAFLTDRAREVLRLYLEHRHLVFDEHKTQELIFGANVLTVSSRNRELLSEACQRLGIPRLTNHSFRHCVGYHLLRAGMGVRHIQQVLGHKSIKSTEIYTKVDKTSLRKVVDEFHPRSGWEQGHEQNQSTRTRWGMGNASRNQSKIPFSQDRGSPVISGLPRC